MNGTGRERSGVDVLIAEDNEVNQMVFSFIMEELGYSFEIVGDGEAAVARFQELRPPVVIMDISMPVMNGIEATRKIRELENGCDDPAAIIAATAHALKGDSERCLAAGMDDYIAKPISPDKLKSVLEQWFDRISETAAAG
ncbi:MAG: response regulator [Rhizobiaceae bacterium]